MPGTLTDDIEIIDAGHGGGHGRSRRRGRRRRRFRRRPFEMPQRAYFTVIQLGLAGIMMFFMALDQFVPGAQGPGERLGGIQLAAHSLGQYAGSAGQQRHHSSGTAIPAPRSAGRIQALVGAYDGLGHSVLGRPIDRLAAARGARRVPGDQSQQQFFLCADGCARAAPGGRNPGAVVRLAAELAALANHAGRLRPMWPQFIGISWMGCGFFCSHFSIWDGESWHETKSEVGVPVSSPWGGGGSPFAINSKKFGMWLFIVSDTLTFSALLLAYSYSRLANPDWPRPFEIYPAIAKSTSMTIILLVSSLTMVLGVAAAHKNDRPRRCAGCC